MDKQTFLAQNGTLKTCDVPLPSGDTVQVRELTVRERGKLRELTDDPVTAQARIVALGCPILEGDAEAIMDLPGKMVSDMADAILRLSGLMDDESPKAD